MTNIEEHRDNYVVMILRQVDHDRKEREHFHSIVIDVNLFHGRFDIDDLVAFLERSQMESLSEEFKKLGYIPWRESSSKSNAKRLRLI